MRHGFNDDIAFYREFQVWDAGLFLTRYIKLMIKYNLSVNEITIEQYERELYDSTSNN